MAGEGGEFVRCGLEWEAGELGDVCGGAVAELGVRIEASADGGAADGELVESA